MTFKYPAWVCALAVALAACAPPVAAPSASPSPPPNVSASPSAPVGLAALVPATLSTERRWYLVPDAFERQPLRIRATFAGDVTAGAPFVTVAGGPEIPLTNAGTVWTASVDLDAVPPGEQGIALYERLAGVPRVATRVAETRFILSQPEYVVWTLDFEGDASFDPELANTAAIADGLHVPMSILWNPRVWTTSQVSAERQDAMLAWTKDRYATHRDEVGLHLHGWTDYVRAAGIAPRTAPSWAGRTDGYDVPLNAYPEDDQRALIEYGARLMTEHGLPRPVSFRAGGDIGDATTLRAAAAAGMTVDCTAVARTAPPIGRIPYPWTLPPDAQPYRPSRTDANAPGDLPLLEAPTIGGNTYAFTVQSIQPQIRANLAVFAPAGVAAPARKAITLVSHPGTIVPSERAAIEALLGAFGPLRFDADAGPVRFVTLSQLGQAFGR